MLSLALQNNKIYQKKFTRVESESLRHKTVKYESLDQDTKRVARRKLISNSSDISCGVLNLPRPSK